ncbi:MAG: glycosyltransferase [Lachnospiraceae bacterium]|nr:glycosyltransferase [Lachnospiraceae bacterium]
MKIVIHRYNSICEPGYIDAFRALGIDVIEDTDEMTNKAISGSERVGTLAELILTHRPMFVFSINFFPYISEICERLKVLYVCVSVDCPVAELMSVSIRNSCNRIFLFDRSQYLETVKENPSGIFHLPLSVLYGDDELHEPGDFKYDISFIGSLYNEKNHYAEIFDKLSPRVQGLCEGLIGAQELLGGTGLLETVFSERGPATGKNNIADEILSETARLLPDELAGSDDYITDMTEFWTLNGCFGFELTVRDRLMLLATMSETLKEQAKVHLFTRSDVSLLRSIAPDIIMHGGVSTLTGMPEVFRSSRINLNTTMRPIREGLPQRIWDILGVGGFLLTNYQSEIPDYLTVGKHLEAFESPDEACEKAAYYLSHEEERLEIARAGYEEVKSRHLILNRVSSMIGRILDTIGNT